MRRMQPWVFQVFVLIGALGLGTQARGAGQRPVISMMTTCAQLTSNFYPADTTTWFDSQKFPQVVFYAHMLFPLTPDFGSGQAKESWHPPQVAPKLSSPSASMTLNLSDSYYASAQWLDPDGLEVASFGLTMPARVSSDYVRLDGAQYIPHTFAMTLGIKDLRAQAGQKQLLSKNGQYHVRLYVDSQLEGIAFFKIFGLPQTGTSQSEPRSRTGTAGIDAATVQKALTPGMSESALGSILRLLTQTAK